MHQSQSSGAQSPVLSGLPVAIVGGGPAGLMAAQIVAEAGLSATIYDRMPSPGRKFLLAGRGGLNLTHSEELRDFVARYGAAGDRLGPMVHAFTPLELRRWCESLGQATFVGSSGRIFPQAFKASPLLRAWLARLQALGVRFAPRWRWVGWSEDGGLLFTVQEGESITVHPAATVLALGGASWPRLGSDGSWATVLARRGVAVSPLRAANAGFTVAWSERFAQRFEGEPLKRIALHFGGTTVRGEALITATGIEGGAVYALAALLRDAIEGEGGAVLSVDLRPDLALDAVASRLDMPRGSRSLSTFLRKAVGLPPVAIALLHEVLGRELPHEARALAQAIKALPVRLTSIAPIARAISTAGGVAFEAVDERLMLRAAPGVFVAGEMLDFEAPTGGYLLQAAFATGVAAGKGVCAWLDEESRSRLIAQPP